MALENIQYSHLEELGGSNYEIVDGEPNIQRWNVKIDEEVSIGEVYDVLFDPESRNVRYLIVDLDDEKLFLEEQTRMVLIPIGIAQLYEDTKLVLLPNISLQQIAALPPYQQGKLSTTEEGLVRNIFSGTATEGVVTDEVYEREGFYKHDHFNEDNFFNHTKTPLMQAEENSTSGSAAKLSSEAQRSVSRIAERPASPAHSANDAANYAAANPINPITEETPSQNLSDDEKQGSEPHTFKGGPFN